MDTDYLRVWLTKWEQDASNLVTDDMYESVIEFIKWLELPEDEK